jgi:ADP-ribosylglycohydrolase
MVQQSGSASTSFAWADLAGTEADVQAVSLVSTIPGGFTAVEAAAVCTWMFLRYRNSPEDALVRTIALGGDTDTLACIVGAMLGAYNGASWLPSRWVDAVEDGEGTGKRYALGLAGKIAELRFGCAADVGEKT